MFSAMAISSAAPTLARSASAARAAAPASAARSSIPADAVRAEARLATLMASGSDGEDDEEITAEEEARVHKAISPFTLFQRSDAGKLVALDAGDLHASTYAKARSLPAPIHCCFSFLVILTLWHCNP